jgi:hypothetical protein
MGCSKGIGKCQGSNIRRPEIEVFKHRKFSVQGYDDLPQTLNRNLDADATDTITVFECKYNFLYISRTELAIHVEAIDDDRKGREMCQHLCNRRSSCTNEAKMEMCC